MKQYGSSFAIGFAIAILALFVTGVFTGRDIRHMGTSRAEPVEIEESENDPDETAVPKTGTDAATLSVAAQTAGMEARVAKVMLKTAGWVVVHEIDGGHVLNALGARRLDVGTHTNVAVELLRTTDPGHDYAVILYADNGNKEFEIRGDLPLIDSSGNPLMQIFRTYGGGAAGQ